MATLTIRGNTFTPRSPSVSIVGQVNAEQVTFVVDESWSGLELQAQFSNASIDREPVPVALGESMTCYVPAEATAQPGKVYVALAGYDDGVQIKLTELLHYSNAKTGADPNGGVPPEEQTPSYLNQITQILNETKAVAQSVRDDADQGKFNGKPGKNGEPGKSPKEEGGTWWLWNEGEQKWVDTGILVAGKNGISPKVATQPVVGGTRVIITDADGEKSFDVLNGKNGNPGKNGETPNITIGRVDTLPSGSKATAEITGQTPNLILNMGIPQGREGPAGLGLPTPTQEFAGMVPMVNPEGNGYIFGEASGGAGVLLAEYHHRGNQEIHFASFDWETGIGECTVPHGLKNSKQALIAGSASFEQQLNLSKVPIEWSKYNDAIWVVPVDETHVRVAGGKNLDQISVNPESPDNSNININSIWLEIPVRFAINGLSEIKPIIAARMTISGYVMGVKSQYMYVGVNSDAGKLESLTLVPGHIPSTLGAYHGCYCFSDFYLDASNNENHIVFVHSINGFLGRKPGSSTETSKASSNHVDFLGFQGQVNSIDSFRDYYGVYSNGTIVRIYALGVKQE